MVPRYARPAMTAIWEPEARFRIWFEIEAHATEKMGELGVVPKSAGKALWDWWATNPTIDVAAIDAELQSPQRVAAKLGRDYEDLLDELNQARLARERAGLPPKQAAPQGNNGAPAP